LYHQSSELEKHEFQSEVSMGVQLIKDDIYMATEKMLYKVGKDETKSTEIPLISDIVMDEKEICLLHSGTLSIYDLNLKRKEKTVIPANVNEIVKMDKKLYGLGTNDLVGNMGKHNEFVVRLPVKEKFFALDKNRIYCYGDGLVQAYKMKLTSPLSKDVK